MLELNKIYNGDCLELMKNIDDNSIDLIVTSPPYNVGIEYDSWNDKLSLNDYFNFAEKWLSESFRVLKSDGRIALNVSYEANQRFNSERLFFASDYWQVMKKIGFKFFGLVDLKEDQPERVKYTAWGSWLSASSPYIYNPKECVIIAYKKSKNKLSKGKSYFTSENKQEFIKLVSGVWDYTAETKKYTEANYSLTIPLNALKILSYENDIVLDPFIGSGTTAIACLILKRNYIGFEISEKYYKIALERVKEVEYQQKLK